jgi:hypothetical protein
MKQNYTFADYFDIEKSILSCVLQKPELMDRCTLENKHFKKNAKLFIYLKTMYERFGNLDITLMASVTTDKGKVFKNIMPLLDLEPSPNLFDKYQEVILQLYQQQQQEKEDVVKIYELTNKLTAGIITVEEFKKEIEKI